MLSLALMAIGVLVSYGTGYGWSCSFGGYKRKKRMYFLGLSIGYGDYIYLPSLFLFAIKMKIFVLSTLHHVEADLFLLSGIACLASS